MPAAERTTELGSDDESQLMVPPPRCADLSALPLQRWRRFAVVCAVSSLVAVALVFLFLARPAASPFPQGSPAQARVAHAISERSVVELEIEPTIYCVSSMLLDSYEQKIFKSLLFQGRKHRIGLGIFGCDGFDVYSARKVWLGRHYKKGPVHTIGYTQVPVGTSNSGNAANAELFVNMWSEVQRRSRTAQFDWTVKVDPDTVLFPQRLRAELREHALVAEQKPMFLTNCGGGRFYSASSSASSAVSKRQLRASEDAETVTGNAVHAYFNGKSHLYGALEVFSRKAMSVYFREAAHCQGSQIHKMGEDEYMGMCLNKFGVAVPDLDIIADAVCSPTTCEKYAAAYHPHKTVKGWWGCWQTAFTVPDPSEDR